MGLKPRETPTADAEVQHGRTDAWLLVAVDQSHGDLVSIISTADYLNRAVITFEELSCGLFRLVAAGLVKRAPRGYATSARGRAFFARLDPMIRSTLAAADAALVSSAGPTPGFEITRAEYDRALFEYMSRF